MSLAWRAAARSDVGLVRSSNQDSGFAGTRFLVVADGMGGHAGGDVASSVAVAELVGLDDESHGEQAPQHLAGAVARAQDALLRRVAAEPALAGMGTTVTALLRAGERLVLAHLGDSRGYLLHEGRLTQITRDHTFVQRLVDEGRITAEEAEHHPQRNVILRVLGDVQSSPEPDLSVREAHLGDRWLLCSDGLPRVVSDDTIGRTLREVDDVGECADRLVQLALRAGAPDNVTCVVADVVEADPDGAHPEHELVGAASDQPGRSGPIPTSPALRAAVLGRSATLTAAGGAPVALADRAEEIPAPTEVPAGAGDVGGPHPEPHPPGRTARARWGLRALVLLAVAVVLAGGALAGSAWLGRQYYVADDDGRVAIFRGLSQDVGPLSLSSLVSRDGPDVSALPPIWQERVAASISASSLTDAQRIVTVLRSESAAAAEAAEQPSPTTAPSDSATATASTLPEAPAATASTAPAGVAP